MDEKRGTVFLTFEVNGQIWSDLGRVNGISGSWKYQLMNPSVCTIRNWKKKVLSSVSSKMSTFHLTGTEETKNRKGINKMVY